MIRARAVAVVLAVVLLVTACGAANPASNQAPPSAGASVLAFTAKTLDGKEFQGQSLAGKSVVFWFWAPWCPKCRAEAPAVKASADKYKNVAFVGVAGLDTEPAMKEFVQQTGTGDIVQLSDEKGEVWTKLGVTTQSFFIFMKPDGSMTHDSGPLGADKLDAHVEALLAR